jgi:hypothetical protein
MEKEYPAANLISGWSRHIMFPDCSVLAVVVIETPSALFDGNRPSVSPIYINVIEVVVGGATRNILP